MSPAPMSLVFLASVALAAITGCSDGSVVARDEGSVSQASNRAANANGGGDRPARSELPRAAKAQAVAPGATAARQEEQVAADTSPTRRAATLTSGASFDWPHWRGPHGNNISEETGLLHRFPASGPNVLWRQKLGTGFSGLSVAGGRVFTLFGENGREKIACFDADTGDERWKIDSDADFAQGRSYGPRATPWVDGDRVYVVGASGMLFCLEAATGAKVWSFNIYDKFDMQRFVHPEGLSCSPVIDGDNLLVLAGNSALAFNKRSGELVWRALDEKMNHTTPTLATIDGRKQLLVLTGSNLVGLDPASGRELWRHEQRGVNCASPVVGPDDQVFTAASYGFGCQLVRVAGGAARQVYKNNALATHHATAVLYEGCLYGFHDRPGIFKCVDFRTGEEKWVSRAPGKGKLIIADRQMIIVTERGELVLAPVSAEGFRETASARVLEGTCYTAPSLAGGRLYLRSDQEMVCLQLRE